MGRAESGVSSRESRWSYSCLRLERLGGRSRTCSRFRYHGPVKEGWKDIWGSFEAAVRFQMSLPNEVLQSGEAAFLSSCEP